MKILICTGIYPPDIGGPATYSKLLFEELPKRDIDVEVLSFGEVRKYPKIFRHFLYFLKVLKKAKGVDLVYAQDPVSVGMPACRASKILRKKFVLKMVGDYAWEQFQNQKSKIKNQNEKFVSPEEFQNRRFDFVTELRRKIERIVAKKSDQIVVPSEYLKKIVRMWGVDESKIKVIYNAFSPKDVAETKDELRSQFAFGGKIIFSAGRLVPWKGFAVLIEIMKDIRNAKLFIAGDGPEDTSLRQLIKKLGLEEKVVLLGSLNQNELLKMIKASDVFVLNTGYEGLSHQLLEVMSLGTPIITTRVGGNPELISDNKEGILVDYNNKEQLKNMIASVLNGFINTEHLTENAKEKVKFFNREKMLSEIAEILKSVVG